MKIIKNKLGIRKMSLNDQDHMQSGYAEGLGSLGNALINVSDPVILNGCLITKVGTSYSISDGSIFYQSEVFQLRAKNSLNFPSDPFFDKFQFVNTLVNPATVTYQSGGDAAVHLENEFKLNTTGIVRWDQIRRVEWVLKNKLSWIGKLELSAVDISDFDNTGLGKLYTAFESWAICNGSNGTIDMGGIVPIGKNNGTALADVRDVGDYNVIGALVGKKDIKLTAAQSGVDSHTHDPHPDHSSPIPPWKYKNGINSDVIGNDGSGGDWTAMPTTGDVSAGARDANQAHENRQPSRVVVYIQKVA